MTVSTLLPYQQRWIDDKTQVKVWDADRQIGTTFAALHEVAERLLSVRVDGDTCSALWIADSARAHSEAQREFHGMNGQVVWSVGVPTHDVEHMAAMLGPLGIVVVDNVGPSSAICRYLARLVDSGVRARFVSRPFAASWANVSRAFWNRTPTAHQTTIMDAVREGLGQRVADTRGEQWTYAWEFRWLAGIADLMEDQVDCPRFHGTDS